MTTDFVSPVTGRTVRLHWNSRLARLAGGINNCMTLSARHIFISRDWITAGTLAHEDAGHTVQAAERGWLYLPWVAWCFVRYGYAKSPAEVNADDAMRRCVHLYQNIGPVPSYIQDAP
jgi:hypothetical protein